MIRVRVTDVQRGDETFALHLDKIETFCRVLEVDVALTETGGVVIAPPIILKKKTHAHLARDYAHGVLQTYRFDAFGRVFLWAAATDVVSSVQGCMRNEGTSRLLAGEMTKKRTGAHQRVVAAASTTDQTTDQTTDARYQRDEKGVGLATLSRLLPRTDASL